MLLIHLFSYFRGRKCIAYFVEHQSTINPNMPLRMLMYAGRVYSEYVHSHSMDINRGSLQRIPAPRLVVFYNGERFTEDAVVLRLSDAFKNGQRGNLEAEVTMLNINYGRNKELMGRCRPLSDYSLFVATVRKSLSEGKTMKKAVHLAIGKLADDSPIKKHLTDMEAQVVFNCLTEFNAELHDESMRDDGRKAEKAEIAKRMLADGMNNEKVAQYSDLSLAEVQKLAAGK